MIWISKYIEAYTHIYADMITHIFYTQYKIYIQVNYYSEEGSKMKPKRWDFEQCSDQIL